MARRPRNGVVKQLSNLSIDEVSLVDRGANQHATVAISKRAPEVEDVFEFEKKELRKPSASETAAWTAGGLGGVAAFRNRESKTGWDKGGLKTLGGIAAGSTAGSTVGRAVGGVPGHLVGSLAGGAAGGAAVVHEHEKNEEVKRAKTKGGFKKALDAMDLDDLFDVSKKSSFGQGGEQAKIDTISGSDPAGVLKDSDKEKDVGPDGKISGVETTTGEDTPPKKAKKKGASSEVNPSELSGLGKSADFWTGVIEKVLEDGDQEFIAKHFPGGGGNPMDPSQSPFPGAQGAGAAPTMQTPGVQPMGMGQPTPPPGMGGGMGQMGAPGQPTGGMPQQLPPDVVAYIQQLEQALQQAQGGDSDGDSDNSDASSNSDNSEKKNPFGKSGDFGMDTNDLFLQELAKSLDQEDNREMIGKAYEAVSKAEARAQAAEEIAKAERDLRLEREFIAKADEFNVPVSSKELGPVLKRLAETVTVEDFQTIVKCLRGTSEQASLFTEVGKRGGGDNGSILDEVNARAQEFVGKSLTPEQAVTQVFEMDPRAYDAYVAERRSARNSF